MFSAINTCSRHWIAMKLTVVTMLFLLPVMEAWSFAKGWSEEKQPVNVSGVDENRPGDVTSKAPRIFLDIASSGDYVYIVYAGDHGAAGIPTWAVAMIVSKDAGKTWSSPQILYQGNSSTPAIWAKGESILVVWPAEEFDGEKRFYQLQYAYSTDRGQTWKEQKKALSTMENTRSPRILDLDNRLLLAWIGTPTTTISTDTQVELTPENMDMDTLKMRDRGSLEADQNRLNVTLNVTDITVGSSVTFSPARQVTSYVAATIPQTFCLFEESTNNLLLVANQNAEFVYMRSSNQGASWLRQSFKGSFYAPDRISMVIGTAVGLEGLTIPRIPFRPVTISYQTEKESIDLTEPTIVRSLPRLTVSGDVRHVAWTGGREFQTWISYLRSDNIRPQTKILAPADGTQVTELQMKFDWEGSDNISDQIRLVYSYRFDDDPWSEFAPDTTMTVDALPDGDHTFEIRAEDVAGNVQDPPSKITFNTTQVAPDTTVNNPEEAEQTITNRSFTLKFLAKDNTDAADRLKYEVRLDDGPWEAAQSPTQHTFQHLSNGKHFLIVRAADTAGNIDPTPAAVTVNVMVGIAIEFTVVPPDHVSNDAIHFEWMGRDETDPNAQFSYWMKVDEAEAQLIGSATETDLKDLPEGHHEVRLWAVDSANNRSNEVDHRFFVDRTPPTITASFKGSYGAGNFPELNVRGDDLPADDKGEPRRVSEFECQFIKQSIVSTFFGGGSQEAGSEWQTFTIKAADTWTAFRSLSMFEWGYIIRLRGKDEGGLTSAEVSIDLTLPKRSPMVWYSIVGVVAVLVLLILVWIVRTFFGRKRPMPNLGESSLDSYTSSSEKEPGAGDSGGSSFDFDSYGSNKKEDSVKDPFA